MDKPIKMHCQDFSFDSKLSANRIEKAEAIFGKKVIVNILCLCLYLLGVKRVMIAAALDLSANTLRAKIRTFLKDGLYSLGDRRQKSLVQPILKEQKRDSTVSKATIKQTQEEIVIEIGQMSIVLRKKNNLQVRAMLLTLVNSNYVTKAEVSDILKLSTAHIGFLSKELKDKDIHCLIDKRKGSQEDYKFTPDVKAELIKEFAVSCLTGTSASGKAIGKKMDTTFSTSFSERSVRFHMQKLGLNGIKKTLPEKYELEKKSCLKS